MIRLVSRLFRSSVSAIGVDLGSSSLKLAQVVQTGDGKCELVGAAAAPIPDELRNNPRGRIDFFTAQLPQLLSGGNGFSGRRVVLALPASCIHLTRVRVPVMDPERTKQAIIFEVSGELPFHPSQAMIRHLIAGEVFVANEPQNEVIVMAARRELVERYLAAAARAGVEVVGVCPEPVAIAASLMAFAGAADDQQIPPPARTNSAPAASPAPAAQREQANAKAFVDIGGSGTRIYIAQGKKIQFARSVSIGSEQFDTAIATQLRIPLADARRLRRQLANKPAETSASTPATGQQNTPSFDLVLRSESAPAAASVDSREQLLAAEQACELPLTRLQQEIDHCLRYYCSTFHTTPLDQLVFVGGVAAQRRLCQQIAKELHVSAKIGDPLECLSEGRNAGKAAAEMAAAPRCALAVAVGLSIDFIQKAQRIQKAA